MQNNSIKQLSKQHCSPWVLEWTKNWFGIVGWHVWHSSSNAQHNSVEKKIVSRDGYGLLTTHYWQIIPMLWRIASLPPQWSSTPCQESFFPLTGSLMTCHGCLKFNAYPHSFKSQILKAIENPRLLLISHLNFTSQTSDKFLAWLWNT